MINAKKGVRLSFKVPSILISCKKGQACNIVLKNLGRVRKKRNKESFSRRKGSEVLNSAEKSSTRRICYSPGFGLMENF